MLQSNEKKSNQLFSPQYYFNKSRSLLLIGVNRDVRCGKVKLTEHCVNGCARYTKIRKHVNYQVDR